MRDCRASLTIALPYGREPWPVSLVSQDEQGPHRAPVTGAVRALPLFRRDCLTSRYAAFVPKIILALLALALLAVAALYGLMWLGQRGRPDR
jgi:hypothetical protein